MSAAKFIIPPVYGGAAAIAGYAAGYSVIGDHGLVPIVCAGAAAYAGSMLALHQLKDLDQHSEADQRIGSESLRTTLRRLNRLPEFQDLPSELKRYVEGILRDTREAIEGFTGSGDDPLPAAISGAILAIRLKLSSGEMHVYRGRLSMRGQRWLSGANELVAVLERDYADNPATLIARSHLESLSFEIAGAG